MAVSRARMLSGEFESVFENKRLGRPKDEPDAEWSHPVGSFNTSAAVAEVAEISSDQTLCRRKQLARAFNPAVSLSDVYERYINDPTLRRSARTMLAHATTRKVAEQVLGASTAITEVSRDDCRRLFETLRSLPKNCSKKYPDLTIHEAIERARHDPKIEIINVTNINAYMARFGSMLNWAVSEEYLDRNPSRGLKLVETVRAQDRRKPFAITQLRKIFSAPIYTGCLNEEHGYAREGPVVATGARYWIPLIGLFSGMRLNEICQLDVADVRSADGVACFYITEDSLNGTGDKSLKTKSSRRLVPVHPTLMELGFIRFVDGKRRGGSTKLFDDVPLGAKGFRSIAFSRWFSRFLKKAGADAAQTCFHSFRHGFRDAVRNARIDRDIGLTLGGWTTGGGHRESAEAYGSGYQPTALFDAMAAIRFEGLDLSHLKHHGRSRDV